MTRHALLRRHAAGLWLGVSVALLGASLAFGVPWSRLMLLCAFCAAVVSMERKMARCERMARSLRGRRGD